MQRISIRTVPLQVAFRQPQFGRVGQVVGGGQDPKFGMAVMLAIGADSGLSGPSNPATDDWNDGNGIGISAFSKGYAGWQVYKDALLARGRPSGEIIETSTTITFRLETALHFLSFFREVILLQGCPPKVIKRIKDYSRVGTRVRLWCLSDRYPTGPLSSGWMAPHRTAALPYLLQGNTVTTPTPNDGGTLGVDVDTEQGTPWRDSANRGYNDVGYLGNRFRHYNPPAPDESPSPGEISGHSWMVGHSTSGFVAAELAACRSQWNSYWSQLAGGLLDGYHSDNINPTFNPGLATNIPPGHANRPSNAAWEASEHARIAGFLSEFFAEGIHVRALSGNIGDHTQAATFSDLKRQYWEHSFLKGDGSGYHTLSAVLSGMTTAMDNAVTAWIGARPIGGSGIPQFETADHSDLRSMAAHANTRGMLGNFLYIFHATSDPNSQPGLYHGPTCEAVA